MRCLLKLLPAAAVAMAAGCAMDDDDRCTGGLEWRPDEAACVALEDTEEPADTSPVQEGLGDVCWTDTDCAAFAATGYDFCLLDPTDPTVEGMCTLPDCTASDCGGEFQCCDCGDFTLPSMGWTEPWAAPCCVDPGTAGLLGAVCSCE